MLRRFNVGKVRIVNRFGGRSGLFRPETKPERPPQNYTREIGQVGQKSS